MICCMKHHCIEAGIQTCPECDRERAAELEQARAEATAAERERCARIADECIIRLDIDPHGQLPRETRLRRSIAAAIRSEKGGV